MRNTGSIEVRKLHPLFGAEITGIDITRPLSAREFGPIRAEQRMELADLDAAGVAHGVGPQSMIAW